MNVSEFLAQSDLIKKQIDDSAKLIIILKAALVDCRITLNELENFAIPDKFTYNTPTHLSRKHGGNRKLCMREMLLVQVTIINELLGDKR